MLFPQALQTSGVLGLAYPCSCHLLLLTLCSHSHLFTHSHLLTSHHTCSHSLSPAHRSRLSVSLPHLCIRRCHVEP